MPKTLRDRAHLVAQRLSISFSDIVREGLRERLEYLINKIEWEEARDRRLAEEVRTKKRESRLSKSVSRLGENQIEQEKPEGEEEKQEMSATQSPAREPKATTEPYAAVLDSFAKQIAATNDPTERRLLSQECLAAVQRRAPLTSPPQSVVLEQLEKEVLRLLDEVDKATEAVVGPKRVVKDVDWAGDI